MVWKSSIITDYNTETLDTEMASVAKKITPNLLFTFLNDMTNVAISYS